jgi:NADH-quinone oxidoreductase subunit N
VGAFYYLRLVKVMYFDEPQGAFDRVSPELKGVLLVTAIVVLFFILLPDPLVGGAQVAAQSLFGQ